MISIIIPAHNESQVLSRTLSGLLAGAAPGELEVIIACNGCTDDTAAVARSVGSRVTVLELKTPSKIAALNAADAIANGFPRIYMDADVRLSIDSARQIAAALQDGTALAAAPALRMDLAGASWPVRAYYRVWLAMPYVQAGMIGAGVYALSAAGRARFERFPDVIADDGYVRQLFAGSERTVVRAAHSTVAAPRDLRSLIKIKARSRLGLYELRQRFPELFQREAREKRYAAGALNLLSRPRLWPDLLPYLLVNLVARWRAKRQLRCTNPYVWERDDSTRSADQNLIPARESSARAERVPEQAVAQLTTEPIA